MFWLIQLSPWWPHLCCSSELLLAKRWTRLDLLQSVVVRQACSDPQAMKSITADAFTDNRVDKTWDLNSSQSPPDHLCAFSAFIQLSWLEMETFNIFRVFLGRFLWPIHHTSFYLKYEQKPWTIKSTGSRSLLVSCPQNRIDKLWK